MSVSVLKCPSCGAPADEGARTCGYCGCSLLPDAIGFGLLSADGVQLERLFKAAQEKLKLDPDDAMALCHLGVCYLKRGQYDQAIKELERAAELLPQAWGVYYLQAFAVAVGRSWLNPQVEQLAKKALSLNPQMKEAQSLLRIYAGVSLAESDSDADYEAAVKEYRQALDFAVPEQAPYLYFFSGQAFDQAGDADDAINMYQQACKLGYSSPEVFVRLGVLLQQAGRPHEALFELERAERLDPANMTVKDLLARLRAGTPGS